MVSFRSLTLCLAALVLFSTEGMSQKKTFHCRKTEQIIQIIQDNHISPKTIDSTFTDQVNNQFISSLDPVALLFTTDDVTIIKSYCPDLLNLDCSENKNFMGFISNMVWTRLKESDYWLDKILNHPIDFNQGDTLFVPDHGETEFPEDENGLTKNWDQYLRFQLLRHFVSVYKSDDTTFKKNYTSFIANLPELINNIRHREECKVNHILNYPGGFDEYIFSIYLNILTSAFDPHTNYFSMNDKEQFESSISRNKNSFGADLEQNDNGEIIIARLIPGGPAWRSGEMSVGDVLLSLKFPERKTLDLFCSNLEEIQNLIYNSGSDHLEVCIRNNMGQVKTLELRIESLASAENSVYGFMLNGLNKIGYVALPGFYTEPDQLDPLGCASDMVNEIRKLESDGMEGLILDVRNNGGGSIVEAVDLAGVFLDSGPLYLYTTRYEKPTLIKDLDRGTLYDGPLVLLVNGYSASAAEILAAILQDQNRALIVGTPTFGKASGQIILPLGDPGQDESELFYYGFDPTDFIKITTTKYYRLNGTSHQARGMDPDITLPVHAGYSQIKESRYPSAFINDTITKDVRFEPSAVLPVVEIQESSKKRIKRSENFTTFTAINDSLRPLYEHELFIPLDFEQFHRDYERVFGLFNALDQLSATAGLHYNIENTKINQVVLSENTYLKDIHQEIIEKLSDDFYLEESYLILADLVRLLNKNKTGP